MTKACSKCSVVKPLDEYHRNKGRKDGRLAQCKPCVLAQRAEYEARPEVKARKAEYRANNRDRRRTAWWPGYYKANKASILARRAEYKAANPQIYWESTYRKRSIEYGFTPVVESFTKEQLIARWGSNCWHCKTGPFEQLDHYLVPVRLGGAHSLGVWV